MARNRTRIRAVSRSVTFGPAVLLPLAGWLYLSEPLGWITLAVMLLAGLLIWPLLVLAVMFFSVDALRGVLVPRRWRVRYRHRYGNRYDRKQQPSSYISARLRRVTYYADRYRCASCHARIGIEVDHLEIDHFRPWAQGGLTTLFNCMTLCQPCNGIKLDYWEDRDGYQHYARRYATGTMAQAAVVMHRLRWHRRNPLRWTRAAWALAA